MNAGHLCGVGKIAADTLLHMQEMSNPTEHVQLDDAPM